MHTLCPGVMICIFILIYLTSSVHGFIILKPGVSIRLNFPNYSTNPAKINDSIPDDVDNSWTQQHLQQRSAHGYAIQIQKFPQQELQFYTKLIGRWKSC